MYTLDVQLQKCKVANMQLEDRDIPFYNICR